MRPFVLASFIACLACPAVAAEPQKGESGLPVPRFVSLKSDEINVRSGPGTRYPIQWVYHKEGLPVEVIEEFDYWRKIRDMEGSGGWVHKGMLAGTRTAAIKGKTAQTLRAEPEDSANPVLKAEPKVVGKISECDKEWCRMQIEGRKGWIRKKFLFGVYPKETFGD